MDFTLQKTITFLIFIGIGMLMKLKFKSKEEINGIKKIILNLALPATIGIALLGVKIDTGLLVLPLVALGLNLLLYLAFPYLTSFTGLEKDTPQYRTARLLIPSLAPGLSCFPFILEFLGDAYLAKAAMADLGNKVFVLIILYLIAMSWHYKLQAKDVRKTSSKVKSLLKSMVSEPVNIFIGAALVLVTLGISMDSLPFVISDSLQRLSVMMTPLVLLFIGLAVNIKKKQFAQLISILFLRAAFVTFVCSIVIALGGISVTNDILLFLAFGLSACSFWPFAHISVVEVQEDGISKKKRTFDSNFAVSLLALSFPLSTMLILGILSSGSLFSSAGSVLTLSGVLFTLGLVPFLMKKIAESRKRSEKAKLERIRYRTALTDNS